MLVLVVVSSVVTFGAITVFVALAVAVMNFVVLLIPSESLSVVVAVVETMIDIVVAAVVEMMMTDTDIAAAAVVMVAVAADNGMIGVGIASGAVVGIENHSMMFWVMIVVVLSFLREMHLAS